MQSIPLLSEYSIKLLTYQKTRAKKWISFSNPCIGYLLHGTAEFWLNGQSYTAHEGDLIYIAAETEYYSLWIGDPQVQWYSVSFAFSNPLAYSDFRFQILPQYPAERWHRMYDAYEKDPFGALAEFYALLSDLYARMDRSSYVPKYAKIRPAVEHLQANCTSAVKVAELAAMCGYSEAHFFTLFQRVMGVSPIIYKTNLLMQRAVQMLLETDDSIDTIAARLGFCSANYFCRTFTKTVKRTPKEVRRLGPQHLPKS